MDRNKLDPGPTLADILAELESPAHHPPSVREGGRAGLGWADKILLGAARIFEPVGGTAGKLYNDIVQRRRDTPITERDFSPEELAYIRKITLAKALETGRPAGSIDYPDYKKYGKESDPNAIPTSLGMFDYQIDDDGNTFVTDAYKFRPERGLAAADRNQPWNATENAGTEGEREPGALAAIGRRVVPPSGALPVRLSIGPKDEPPSLANVLAEADPWRRR